MRADFVVVAVAAGLGAGVCLAALLFGWLVLRAWQNAEYRISQRVLAGMRRIDADRQRAAAEDNGHYDITEQVLFHTAKLRRTIEQSLRQIAASEAQLDELTRIMQAINGRKDKGNG